SALVFEGAVDVDANTLLLDNTAASLDITFVGGLDDTTGGGAFDFGDAAETVVVTAEAAVGATNAAAFTGEALVDLTVNAEAAATFDVAATAAALETVAVNANEDSVV